MNQRTAEVNTSLPLGGGIDGKSPILIPKGASVGYNVFALHRDPDYFGEEVNEFRPERWEYIRPQWAYMPFHAGPRACIGRELSSCFTADVVKNKSDSD
jgi:cytochrome P450